MSSLQKLIVALLALGAALSAKATYAQTQQDHQLNLILHGMTAMVIWPDHVEVLFPEIDDHVYKAGSWGKELRLKQGVTYQLSGVESAPKPPAIDRKNNLVLEKVSRIDRSSGRIFCSLILPLPSQIVGLRRARNTRQRPLFSGRSTVNFAVDSVPLLYTLVYRFQDVNQLSLGNSLAWVPAPDADGTVNLHVWAEPDIDFGAASINHPPHAFDSLMALFPEIQLKLEFSPSVQPERQIAVRGVHVWEQYTFLERSKLLYPVQPAVHEHKGTEVSNCIAVIVDNTTGGSLP